MGPLRADLVLMPWLEEKSKPSMIYTQQTSEQHYFLMEAKHYSLIHTEVIITFAL